MRSAVTIAVAPVTVATVIAIAVTVVGFGFSPGFFIRNTHFNTVYKN